MDIKVDLKGIDEALAKMKTLPSDLEKKGLKRAIRRGAVILKNTAFRNAPVSSAADEFYFDANGNLRSKKADNDEKHMKDFIAIQYAPKLSKRYGGVAFRVGVKGTAKKMEGQKNVYYWRMVEFGTQNMRAQPFMRPAIQKNANKVFDTVAKNIERVFNSIMKAQAKKAAGPSTGE